MRIIILLTACFLLIQANSFSQNIGINNPTPDASSLLDLTSTSQGLLVPRMTTAQRNAITAPANGLLVYDITLSQFYYYNVFQWQPIFSGWSLSGNAGTNPATNFIGTTDDQPLKFRVNNYKAGMIYQGRTYFGFMAGYSDNSNSSNTGIGASALYSNTTGTQNTAIGAGALQSNTTGAVNTATGGGALSYNTTGFFNTAMGYTSLFYNSTGNYNTAVGYYALKNNVAGNNATAIGTHAMLNANNTTSFFNNSNVAVGYEALFGSGTPSANTGNSNTALGYQTLWSNSTGNNNTVTGYQSLYANSIGNNNTAIGFNALNSNVAGSNATAIGTNAMQYANNQASAFTSTNVAVGYEALRGSGTPSANIGSSNTALGYQALWNNSAGGVNTATGYQSLYSNTTGSYNTVNGFQSLYWNTTGNRNTTNGTAALGSNNTGSNNTAEGHSAGISNTSGSNNTFLGYGADLGSPTQRTNATAIGYNAKVDASNALVLGGTGANAVNVGIGTSNPSLARLQVQGIVGNTVAYFSAGANTQGLSLISDWPGLYFNSYYNGGIKSMGNNGFPAIVNTDQASGGIVFQTTNVPISSANTNVSIPERMRITGTGNVGIGTSNPQTALHIGSGGTLRIDDGSGTRFAQLFHSGNGNLHIDAVGGGSTYINWYGGPALYVGNGGAWYGPVFAAGFYAASSARFKKDIVNTRYGLADILKLQAREYKYIEDKTERNEVGLIAEDVEKIIPEVVYRSAEDNQVMGIDYGKLSPVLIEAIREQQKMIDALKTEMAALKSELNAVRNK